MSANRGRKGGFTHSVTPPPPAVLRHIDVTLSSRGRHCPPRV